MSTTVGIMTLGCKVNQYESEALAEAFSRIGFVPSDPSGRCDIYVINTCTVTAESDRKCRQMIRRAASRNPDALLFVTGCLSQVDPDGVASLPNVVCVCGSRNKLRAVEAARELIESGKRPDRAVVEVPDNTSVGFEPMCISHFPRTRAYIKIEDGCESHCAYCIIPRARGRICSKPSRQVLAEIEALLGSGCREAVLTGIETASYGLDLENYRLADLLEDIDRLAAGHMRIRLGSLDPSLIKPEFVRRIAGLSSVAPHFHLSMQSGCDRTLARMKRKYNTDMAKNGVRLLREAMPDVQFTSDFICGFPGETDSDFRKTAAFIDEIGFLDSHIFTYSPRRDTVAASLPDRVPVELGRARTAELIALQRRVTERVLGSVVGREYEVLFETDADGISRGHTASFIEVQAASPTELHATLRRVRIVGHENGIAEGKVISNKQ